MRVEDLSRESRRFVEDTPSLESYFSLSLEDRRSGIVELMRHLLDIDPAHRYTNIQIIELSLILHH